MLVLYHQKMKIPMKTRPRQKTARAPIRSVLVSAGMSMTVINGMSVPSKASRKKMSANKCCPGPMPSS